MTFTQLTTVLAIVIGPLGIALGFGFSMWGEQVKARREANSKRREQAVSRALGLLAAADMVEGQGRILAYAAYLRHAGQRPGGDQMQAEIGRFNSGMATLSRLVLEADVLGPDGLGDIGRALQAQARDFSNIVNDMMLRADNTIIQKLQDETMSAFVAAIEEATVQMRVLLEENAPSPILASDEKLNDVDSVKI